ncbi:MAG: hypothetical protein IT305_01640 [Chloroflexi bacterium]|nr:hypothetical protein [Chloroflexota bacterium]
MKLMLAAMICALLVGLLFRGRRRVQRTLVVTVAVALTTLYYLFADRFM